MMNNIFEHIENGLHFLLNIKVTFRQHLVLQTISVTLWLLVAVYANHYRKQLPLLFKILIIPTTIFMYYATSNEIYKYKSFTGDFSKIFDWYSAFWYPFNWGGALTLITLIVFIVGIFQHISNGTEKNIFKKEIGTIIKNIMKKTITIILLLTLVSCVSKKEFQRNKDLHKTEISEKTKVISELKKDLDFKFSENKSLEEKLTVVKKEYEKRLSEAQKKAESKSEDTSDEVEIKNAKGNVKITDSKGNSYEVPSDSGTTISKTSIAKLQSQISEEKQINSELKFTNSELKKDLNFHNNVVTSLQEVLQKKSDSLSTEKSKSKNLQLQIDKKVEQSVWWMWFLAGFISVELFKVLWNFLKKQNFYLRILEQLKRKR